MNQKKPLKILLIKSSQWEFSFYLAIPYPLGVLYLASYTKKFLNYPVEFKVLDMRLKDYTDKEIEEAIKKFNPAIVGISALNIEYKNMYRAASIAKKVNSTILVVAGGPYPTNCYDEVLADKNIDLVVRHEGEITFLEIVKNYIGSKGFNDVEGIAYRNSDNIVLTKDRNYIEDLDSIPFPAWDLIDLKDYAKKCSMTVLGPRNNAPLVTSRGCPYNCYYCHEVFGKKYRLRSAKNVLEEIDVLVKKYGVKEIEIIDDIFNLNYKRAERILDGIINENYDIKISFPNGLRSDLLDYNIISKLKKAGTIVISFAIETASLRMQKIIGKNLDLEKAKKAIDIAVSFNMITFGFFMMGFPEETEEEMLETKKFALESNLHIMFLFKLVPNKGTVVYKKYENLIKQRTDNQYLKKYGYSRTKINLTNLSDNLFHKIYQQTYFKFYFSLRRVLRIFKGYIQLRGGIFIILRYFFIFFRQTLIRCFESKS